MLNQQQLAEAERQRKAQESATGAFWSSKFGQAIFWIVIIMLGVSYCSERKSDVTKKAVQTIEVNKSGLTRDGK